MQVRFHVFAGGIRGLDLLDHVPQVGSLGIVWALHKG